MPGAQGKNCTTLKEHGTNSNRARATTIDGVATSGLHHHPMPRKDLGGLRARRPETKRNVALRPTRRRKDRCAKHGGLGLNAELRGHPAQPSEHRSLDGSSRYRLPHASPWCSAKPIPRHTCLPSLVGQVAANAVAHWRQTRVTHRCASGSERLHARLPKRAARTCPPT